VHIEPGLYMVRRRWVAEVTELDEYAPYFPVLGVVTDPDTGEVWPCKWNTAGRFVGNDFESELDITCPLGGDLYGQDTGQEIKREGTSES